MCVALRPRAVVQRLQRAARALRVARANGEAIALPFDERGDEIGGALFARARANERARASERWPRHERADRGAGRAFCSW